MKLVKHLSSVNSKNGISLLFCVFKKHMYEIRIAMFDKKLKKITQEILNLNCKMRLCI